MIGLVIVSHSARLALGLKEMALAMNKVAVPIAAAGGLDVDDNALGSDALRILSAIEEVYSSDGVLVFTDIGSTRLNAEMAIDLLDEDRQANVTLCLAPLVEGTLAASVQIALGATMEEVIHEAITASPQPEENSNAEDPRLPTDRKIQAVGKRHSDEIARSWSRDQQDAEQRRFEIRNAMGLHARPAALLVHTVGQYDGDIRIRNVSKAGSYRNAKSINAILTSDITAHDVIEIMAPTVVAQALFNDIQQLIDRNFDEPAAAQPATHNKQTAPEPPVRSFDKPLQGIPISHGLAVGMLRHMKRTLSCGVRTTVTDTDKEKQRLTTALDSSEADIIKALANTSVTLAEHDRKIFDAHLLLLKDPELIQKTWQRLENERLNAESAWVDSVNEAAATYRSLQDPLLQARVDDLIDVGLHVLNRLQGHLSTSSQQQAPAILAYDELRPSDVLTLDTSQVMGIVVAGGNSTSHAGILAAGLSVPVVFGLGETLEYIPTDRQVLLDGQTGILNFQPDELQLQKATERLQRWKARSQLAVSRKLDVCRTADGHHVRVAANLASMDSLQDIVTSGAEEIGLFRTEFLYMNRNTPPDEEEQLAVYRKILEQLHGRVLTIRTMDIGGDKPVPYLDRLSEVNPNLGCRGIRFSLSEKTGLLRTQLAAAVRASAFGKVRIMFPLVSTLEELFAAQRLLHGIKSERRSSRKPADETLEVGIMIEVPAAVEMADELARHVDFFSLGTNDLTQYVMACDRSNPALEGLFNPLQPAVLKTIRRTIDAAHANGIWVGMCGAMAGNPLTTPLLLGMGLDEFSMNASDIPEFKLTCSEWTLQSCRDLAADALHATTLAEVTECLESAAARQTGVV